MSMRWWYIYQNKFIKIKLVYILLQTYIFFKCIYLIYQLIRETLKVSDYIVMSARKWRFIYVSMETLGYILLNISDYNILFMFAIIYMKYAFFIIRIFIHLHYSFTSNFQIISFSWNDSNKKNDWRIFFSENEARQDVVAGLWRWSFRRKLRLNSNYSKKVYIIFCYTSFVLLAVVSCSKRENNVKIYLTMNEVMIKYNISEILIRFSHITLKIS